MHHIIFASLSRQEKGMELLLQLLEQEIGKQSVSLILVWESCLVVASGTENNQITCRTLLTCYQGHTTGRSHQCATFACSTAETCIKEYYYLFSTQ